LDCEQDRRHEEEDCLDVSCATSDIRELTPGIRNASQNPTYFSANVEVTAMKAPMLIEW
jgi:hypothetical protein